MKWSEVFGYIMGVFSLNDRDCWQRTPKQIRVLYQQARRERERRKAETASAFVLAYQKDAGERIARIEEAGL